LVFPKTFFCFRVKEDRVTVEVSRVSENTVKYVFGQTYIRASELDSFFYYFKYFCPATSKKANIGDNWEEVESSTKNSEIEKNC